MSEHLSSELLLKVQKYLLKNDLKNGTFFHNDKIAILRRKIFN